MHLDALVVAVGGAARIGDLRDLARRGLRASRPRYRRRRPRRSPGRRGTSRRRGPPIGSSPSRKRAMSRSWIIMSRKSPPERSTKLERRRRRIARSDRHDLDIADLAGGDRGGAARAKCGSKRRLKPTISLPPAARTTSRQARMRAALRSTGFSQNTALPARAARSIRSAWVSVGVQITTASMSGAATIASTEPTWRRARSRGAAPQRRRHRRPRQASARGCAATLPP